MGADGDSFYFCLATASPPAADNSNRDPLPVLLSSPPSCHPAKQGLAWVSLTNRVLGCPVPCTIRCSCPAGRGLCSRGDVRVPIVVCTGSAPHCLHGQRCWGLLWGGCGMPIGCLPYLGPQQQLWPGELAPGMSPTPCSEHLVQMWSHPQCLCTEQCWDQQPAQGISLPRNSPWGCCFTVGTQRDTNSPRHLLKTKLVHSKHGESAPLHP